MYTDEEEDDHEEAAEAEQGMEPEGGEEADLGSGRVPEPEVGAHGDTEANHCEDEAPPPCWRLTVQDHLG